MGSGKGRTLGEVHAFQREGKSIGNGKYISGYEYDEVSEDVHKNYLDEISRLENMGGFDGMLWDDEQFLKDMLDKYGIPHKALSKLSDSQYGDLVSKVKGKVEEDVLKFYSETLMSVVRQENLTDLHGKIELKVASADPKRYGLSEDTLGFYNAAIGIVIKPGIFGEESASYFNGYHSSYGYREAITHEFGHMVEQRITNIFVDFDNDGNLIEGGRYSPYWKWSETTYENGNVTKALSRYGTTNPSENFAEHFAAYATGSPKTSDSHRAFEKMMSDVGLGGFKGILGTNVKIPNNIFPINR